MITSYLNCRCLYCHKYKIRRKENNEMSIVEARLRNEIKNSQRYVVCDNCDCTQMMFQ